MSNPSRSWQQTKTCISGFACSSYVKSGLEAGAEEAITVIQRPKRRCSSMLWSMESMTRRNRSHSHPLHPGLAQDSSPDTVLPLDSARSGRESKVDCARLSLTIIQFTADVILFSKTHSQQAHICKSYKSPLAMGERRSSRRGNTGSCSCGPARRRLLRRWSRC